MKKFLALVAIFALVAFATPVFAAANPFMDVPMNHWAYDAIGQLAARGVLSGYPNGAYKGNQPMTRYEVASAVARALAVVDMTKASKQDVEMLKKLVVEFKDELDALGVKVDQLDSRVAVLEKGVGGWSISGSFRMDWKWADQDAGFYTNQHDQDLTLRTPSNYLQFVKRIDDKVSYRARLRRTDDSGMNWTENFITVKFPWDITARIGRTSLTNWEGDAKLYQGDYGDEAWFMDGRYEGMVFDKPFGMGMFSFLWGHDDGTANGAENTFYGARVRFNFNEQFSMGLNAFIRDYESPYAFGYPTLFPAGSLTKWQTYWIDLGFNFTPDVALRGMYAMNKYDWNVATYPALALLDDSPKAFKVLVDVNQNALKFTSLWLEYGKLDANFATHNNPFSYGEQSQSRYYFGAPFSMSGPAFLIDNPLRAVEMSYWFAFAEQKWNDQFATFLRYLNVDYDVAGGPDHKNWLFGMRYMYTPALQFELLYDAIDFDAPWGGMDDHMIRFRTSVSF